MNLILPFADALIERSKATPYFHIYDGGSLYMERYWLTPRSQLVATARGYELAPGVKWCARIHHIVRPDLDRHMHDHPCDFLSVVLRGGYVEKRPTFKNPIFHRGRESMRPTFRGAGSVAFRRAHDRHLISELHGDVWTLFLMRRTDNPWGFWTPDGKVFWERYEAWKRKQDGVAIEAQAILDYGLAIGIPGHLRSFIEDRIAQRGANG